MTLAQTLVNFRKANIPVLVFGPPGCGKSSAAKEAAEGDELIDLRLSMLDPLDLRGLPIPKNDSVSWVRPEFLPREGKGILLLDELNTAPPAVMNAALQLVLDRKCGPHQLPKDWWVMACGNRSQDKALVNTIPSPLLSRFAVINCTPNIKEWTAWATKSSINEDVIGFLNFRESLLYQEPSDNEYANFPTPRSWATVSKMIDYGMQENFDSVVGEGADIEFNAYRQSKKDLPDLDSVLNGNFDKLDNLKASLMYAAVTGLATRCIRNGEKISNGIKAVSKFPPEMSALFIWMILSACPDKALMNTDIAQWAKDNRKFFQ